MKVMFRNLLLVYSSCLFLWSCSNTTDRSREQDSMFRDSVAKSKADSIANRRYKVVDDPSLWYDLDAVFDTMQCTTLHDRKLLLGIAMQNDLHVENGDIDTSDVRFFVGHFSDSDSLQTLVLMSGYDMPSCGDGCNKAMLFSCDPKVHLLWAGFTPYFTESCIRDLDKDGVLEIIATSSVEHMGECHSRYEILNLKNRELNELYSSDSYSYVSCGFAEEYDIFDKGDSISAVIKDSLVDPDHDGIFQVCTMRKRCYFNGGKTESQIVDKQLEKVDTVVVSLKSF